MKEVVRNNIRSLRVRANLTQEEVAKTLGITRQQYYLYEKEPLKIKVDILIKLADLFNCKVEDFILQWNGT